jgi:flagellar basal body-associated protein FliL
MSKLDPLITKIQDLKTKISRSLRQILLKIPVLKKYVPSEATKAELAAKSGTSTTLAEVYREGFASTRLAVIFVFILFGCSLYFGGGLIRDRIKQHNKTKQLGVVEKDIAEKIKKERERVSTGASVVSIGHIATDTVKPDGSHAFINVDIWVVCDNPETARNIEETAIRTHSTIIDSFRILADQKVSPLTDQGRAQTRAEIIKAINSSLTHGKITDLNFYNLIIE